MTTHTDQSATPPPPPPPPAPPGAPGSAKRPWYKRTWVVAVAALLVGLGVGASGSDVTTSTEYQQVSAELDQAREDLAAAEEDLEAAQREIESVAGDLPQREADLEAAQADLEAAQAALADREAAVKSAEKDVAARERKVGIAEATAAKNTISGEGMYEAGADIKPGTYKTSGRKGCYYAVLNSPDTFDIAVNNNIDGPGILTVNAGQYLMLSGCADWVRQQ